MELDEEQTLLEQTLDPLSRSLDSPNATSNASTATQGAHAGHTGNAVASLLEYALSASAKYLETHHDAISQLPDELVERLVAWMVQRLHPNQNIQLNQTISIKVSVQRQNRVLGIRAKRNDTIANVLNEVYDRIRDLETLPIEEYGLFIPRIDHYRAGQWLHEDKTISYFDLKSGDLLEFKMKKTVLQIEFLGYWEKVIHPLHNTILENTSKSFVVDQSKTIAQIAKEIALKLEIQDTHEFSLKLISNVASNASIESSNSSNSSSLSSISSNASSISSNSALSLSSSTSASSGGSASGSGSDGDNNDSGNPDIEGANFATWLNPEQTFCEQNIDPRFNKFLFCKMFSIKLFEENIQQIKNDYSKLHFLFCQCVDAIIHVTYPCTFEEAIYLAALQCQSTYGDFGVMQFNCIEIKLKDVLPNEYLFVKNAKQLILNQYRKLKGKTEIVAKSEYIRLARSLKSFGYTCFAVIPIQNKPNSNSNHPAPHPRSRSHSNAASHGSSNSSNSSNSISGNRKLYLGISEDSILILDGTTKQIEAKFSLTDIQKWQILSNFISISLEHETYSFLTNEAEAISETINGYLNYNLREKPEEQFRWSNEYNRVSRQYRRSRSNSNSEAQRLLNDQRITPNTVFHLSPLYVEPKKIFHNPLFAMRARLNVVHRRLSGISPDENANANPHNPIAQARARSESRVGEFPNEHEISLSKQRKLVKMISVISTLSRKMSGATANAAANAGAGAGAANEAQDIREEFHLQVRFADKKQNVFLINPNKTVSEIANDIGCKLEIRYPEEFSLQDSNKQWLDPYSSIAGLGIVQDQILFYRRKFYFNEESEDFVMDPVYSNLVFFQSRDEILQNRYSTNIDEAVQLAATLFQVNFGDYNGAIHKPGFIKPKELKFFLPPECLDLWGVSFSTVESMIYKEHRMLLGMRRSQAKLRYILLCKQLKSYGTIFFPVKKAGKKLKPHPLSQYSSLMLGISKNYIVVVNQKNKKVMFEIPLTRLYAWSFEKDLNLFTLHFGNYEESKLIFQTIECEAISQYLSNYVDFVQSKNMSRIWSKNLTMAINSFS